MDLQRRRFRIAPTGDFASPADIATVESGYLEPPITLMLYNRQPAIGISITIVSGVNTVNVGERIDQRLDEIIPMLSIGIFVSILSFSLSIASAGNTSTSPLFGIKLSDEQVVQITESDHNHILTFQPCQTPLNQTKAFAANAEILY